MYWKFIFNPFVKFSEKQLLVIGLVFFAVNVWVSYLTAIKMDSVFHFTPLENLSLANAFFYVTLSITFAVVVLFILGKIFNKKTRFIDILNAVLVSQVFNFIILLVTQAIDLNKTVGKAMQNLQLDVTDFILLFSFMGLTIPFVVYGITLLYNGFRTATNIKSWQKITIFVGVLLILLLVSQSISSILKL